MRYSYATPPPKNKKCWARSGKTHNPCSYNALTHVENRRYKTSKEPVTRYLMFIDIHTYVLPLNLPAQSSHLCRCTEF